MAIVVKTMGVVHADFDTTGIEDIAQSFQRESGMQALLVDFQTDSRCSDRDELIDYERWMIP